VSGPDKLSVIVFSGDFDRVHYALAMAAAAAAVDTPATLFFTMGALRALRRADAGGTPGWAALPGAAARDAELVARGVAGFETLYAACAALGVRFMVCEMGLAAEGLRRADLRDDAPIEEGGLVTFLADASASGAVVFV